MKTIIYFLIGLALISLASCEKEIEFKGEISDPLVVVNGYLAPDSTIKIELSKSRFFLDSREDFDRINNATVSIMVNGQTRETLRFANNGIYIGNYKPQLGDSVSLTIKAPGHEEVRSSTVIPALSNIVSVDTLSRKLTSRYESYKLNDTVIAWNNQFELELGIRIKDPATIKNFYRLSIINRSEWTEHPDYKSEYYLYFNIQGVSNETSSEGLLSLIDGGYDADSHVFSDDLFDGREVVVRFKMYENVLEIRPGYEEQFGGKNTHTTSYIINLQSLPRDTYYYLKSKSAAEQVFETFFTEPVQIYTNIENGIGIFGSFTNNRIKLKVN